MDARNKLRLNMDAHRHSSKPWWLDAEMLSTALREGAGWGHSHCSGAYCLCFYFLPSFHKSQTFFIFLQLVKTDTNIVFTKSSGA